MKIKKPLSILLGFMMTLTINLGFNTKVNAIPKISNSTDTSKKIVTTQPQILNASISSEPRILDVSLANDLNSNQILSQIYEGLTRMEQKADGTTYIAAAGATKWECNKKGDLWTFHLRDSYWSDGVKVTAQHYVDSIIRSLDPKTASIYSFVLMPIKNAKEFNNSKIKDKNKVGVRALNPNTLQITLEKPCPYFLELTYLNIMKPQRLDIVNKYNDTYGTESNTLVCNGPFLPTIWIHKSKIVLVKNPHYWDKNKVKLQKVNFNIIREINARMNELYNGNIDFAESIKPEWSEKLKSTNKFNLMNDDKGQINYTMFNQKDKYLKNGKIRKAFILAENRTEKIKELYNGIGEPAYGFCSPSTQIGGDNFRKKVIKDPVTRLMEENKDPKALLIEGLKEIGEDLNPAKMDITLLMSGTSALDIKFAEFTKKSYKNILSVDLKIDYQEWPIFEKDTSEGNYQICQKAWLGDYNDPVNFLEIWTSSAGVNNTGFINEKYDELISKASLTMNVSERFEYLKKAEGMLIHDEGVISPSLFPKYNFFCKKEIKNLMHNNFTGFEFKYVEIK